MPGKKKKAEKDATGEDEILEEIAVKLKEIRKQESPEEENIDEKESGESGLEEDVDSGFLEFDQFIQPMHFEEGKAPVLERIAGSQPGPVFVGGISRTQQTFSENGKKSDEFKYIPGQEENNEPKYIESEPQISREPERADLARIGREPAEIASKINQERFFMQAEPHSGNELSGPEQQWKAEQIDIEKAGRESPFRKEEIKYEKYKPKTPKGY